MWHPGCADKGKTRWHPGAPGPPAVRAATKGRTFGHENRAGGLDLPTAVVRLDKPCCVERPDSPIAQLVERVPMYIGINRQVVGWSALDWFRGVARVLH
jgi:hypothetical protein